MKKSLDLSKYLEVLNIDQSDFDKFFDFYNNSFNEYGNEVYDDIKSRLVHLRYFLENSWWNSRFNLLWKHFSTYSQIIDLGFSVPYLPIHLALNGNLNHVPKLLYVDGSETSKKLGKVILKDLNIESNFIVGDLQSDDTWKQIGKNIEGERILFTSFETIEHLNRPEDFWRNISKYRSSDIIISLPIGPKIPSHSSCFENTNQVKEYISQYLDIKEEIVFEGKSHGSNYSIYTCLGTIK